MCERELETEQNCNILTSPTPPDLAVCRSRSPGLFNRGPGGPASLRHVLIPGSSHQLVSKLTDFLCSPSYIIVQSPTQCFRNGMFDCHTAEITVMQFTGHSLPMHQVYDCSMGFYLVPYCQPSLPTRFLPITAIGMGHFLPVHHFRMACLAGWKVNIQH